MTDDPAKFPPQQFPILFADGITSASTGNGNVKFYLHRVDPSFDAASGVSVSNYAQIVMPIPGFTRAAVFFQHQLQDMIRRGLVKQEDVTAIEETWKADGE